MLGAVIGDIVGSPYEFVNEYARRKIKPFEPTIRGKCKFTDDTAMTLALANVLCKHPNTSDEERLGEKIAQSYIDYYNNYPLEVAGVSSCYGNGFARWAEAGDIHVKRKAMTNGGAMRISPVGWLYDTLEETKRVAKIATERTHDSKKAIEAAQMIAAAIYMVRRTKDKDIIKRYAERVYGYQILTGEDGLNVYREKSKKYRMEKISHFKLKEIINCDAKLSVEEALFAFLNTDNFKDCIVTAVAIGGDSDTIACMAGGIAEAYYGIPGDWKEKAMKVLWECHCHSEDIEMIVTFDRYISPVTENWKEELKEIMGGKI